MWLSKLYFCKIFTATGSRKILGDIRFREYAVVQSFFYRLLSELIFYLGN